MILSMKLSLNGLVEFEESEQGKLFEYPPERWSETEIAICEYTQRMQTEIMADIKKLLIEGNAR